MTDGWLFWIQNLNRNWIRMLLIFFKPSKFFLIIDKKVNIYGRKKQQEKVINT